MSEELRGLPKEIKYIDDEFDFIEPVKIKFRIRHFEDIINYEAELDKVQIIAYREANYGDDKIMPVRARAEYIFKVNRIVGREIK